MSQPPKLPKNQAQPPPPELLEPLISHRAVRIVRVAEVAAIAATAVYFVFFHDFGPRWHVYTPIRDAVADVKARFFAPTLEEQRELDRLKTQAAAVATDRKPSA